MSAPTPWRVSAVSGLTIFDANDNPIAQVISSPHGLEVAKRIVEAQAEIERLKRWWEEALDGYVEMSDRAERLERELAEFREEVAYWISCEREVIEAAAREIIAASEGEE